MKIVFVREDENVMVKIVKAVGGIKDLQIVVSSLNNGAIPGFKDRMVLEYTQILDENGLHALKGLEVPDVFHGLVSSLSMHQTLLGDAIATKDSGILFEALYSYPVKQDTAESKALWKSLLQVAKEEIPSEFQEIRKMFF